VTKPIFIVASLALAIGVPYIALVNHVDQYEAGIAWNFATGQMWLQEPGFHWTAPWTRVSTVDTRPQRVCITSGSHAAFNCKLVQFELTAWQQFVATEGLRYYWFSNRFSLNTGYREEYRGFRDILRGYAFSAQRYPFVTVLHDFDQ